MTHIHLWNDAIIFDDLSIIAKCELCGALVDNENNIWIKTKNHDEYILES